jgi:hypothetical protein
MQKSVVRRFKWFWVWQDETEENWLGEMSEKGYHLISVNIPCIYTFRKEQPRHYIYRLDYQHFKKNDKQEYLQLFKDSGWEYLGNMLAWQYFRKEFVSVGINEIFTDNQSKRAKYKRVLGLLAISFITILAIFLERVLNTSQYSSYPWWGNVHVFLLIVLMALTYAIIKVVLRMHKLRKMWE